MLISIPILNSLKLRRKKSFFFKIKFDADFGKNNFLKSILIGNFFKLIESMWQ